MGGRKVWCDQDRRGGGWTLTMKIDGTQPTFLGNSVLWDNTVLINEASLDPKLLEEAKLAPYLDEPLAEIMLVVDGTEDVVMRMRGENLRKLMASGLTLPAQTPETEWRAAFLPGVLQPGCRRQGIGMTNQPTPGDANRLRLDVLANNEADECTTADSFVGVGGEIACDNLDRLSAGNVAAYDGAPLTCVPHRVDIYVRGDDETRFASEPSCKAHLELGRRSDGVYLVNQQPRRCDMTTDGGGWTSALDFDGVRDRCPPPWLPDPSDLQICIAPGVQSESSLMIASPIGAYVEVMTTLTGYQRSNTDSFHPPIDLEQIYVDGLSITTGAPRQHIATYAAGYSESTGCGGPINVCNCPCVGGVPAPAFTNGAYRCEAGALGVPEPDLLVRPDALFDGSEINAACESEASPEPIRTRLAAPVTTDIEARLMRDEPDQGEGLAIYRFNVWVR